MTDTNLGADGTVDGGESATTRVPPFVSFATFMSLLSELKTNGVPPQIDASVLRRFNGSAQAALRHGLKALALVQNDRPQPALLRLVDSYDAPGFESALRELLERAYPYVFAMDLTTATPLMFAQAFASTGAKEEVARKCRTFFLHAAKKAAIPLGTRLQAGSVPRNGSSGVAKRKGRQKPAGEPHPSEDVPQSRGHVSPAISDKALEYKLVDLMKEHDVGDEERGAIWTLIQYLTLKAKSSQANTAAGT